MLFLFDYGDNWEFIIRLESLGNKVAGGNILKQLNQKVKRQGSIKKHQK